MKTIYNLSLMFFALWGCGEEHLPKPKAMLRLSYPEARYINYTETKDYQFKKNIHAIIHKEKDDALRISYPKMKATIFITHSPVNNNIDRLLSDAQKLTYGHVIKANAITAYPFINSPDNVYGMLYEVSGDAASQLQFYVTDSTRHFVTGALYFYAKPNYDSIFPATIYLKKDIQHLMESMRWNK